MALSANVNERKQKRQPMTDEQVQFFCDFIRENHVILFGKAKGTERVAEQRRKTWELLTSEMESVGLHNLTEQECRNQWSEMKKRAKKYRDNKNKTGGGKCIINNQLEMILAVMPEQALEGAMGQETETGACSQNTIATDLLHGMSGECEVEEAGEMEEDPIEGSSAATSAPKQSVPKKSRKRKSSCSVVDQHTEYQERLLQINQAMLEQQIKIATTFENMLVVLNKIADKLI